VIQNFLGVLKLSWSDEISIVQRKIIADISRLDTVSIIDIRSSFLDKHDFNIDIIWPISKNIPEIIELFFYIKYLWAIKGDLQR